MSKDRTGNRGPGSDAFIYELGALRLRREKLQNNIETFKRAIEAEEKLVRDCTTMIETLERKAEAEGAATEDPTLFE